MAGKQLKLFLVDGTPGGLTTAEITNWTGHVLQARRSDLAELLKREESGRTGVYILLGDDETATGGVRCYIGEADVVATRLKMHQKEKDFWDRVIVVTSKDANLTKAHGRYLESSLISLAKRAGRVSLENGTQPPTPNLPEADASDMDYFVDQLKIVLPVLGVNAIRVPERKPSTGAASEPAVEASPVFRLVNRKLGVDAQAQQIDGEFVVLQGSRVVPAMPDKTYGTAGTSKQYAGRRAAYNKLVADGAVVVDATAGIFTRDVVFTSPSAAAALTQGLAAANGRVAWATDDGMTFGDWESRGVE